MVLVELAPSVGRVRSDLYFGWACSTSSRRRATRDGRLRSSHGGGALCAPDRRFIPRCPDRSPARRWRGPDASVLRSARGVRATWFAICGSRPVRGRSPRPGRPRTRPPRQFTAAPCAVAGWPAVPDRGVSLSWSRRVGRLVGVATPDEGARRVPARLRHSPDQQAGLDESSLHPEQRRVLGVLPRRGHGVRRHLRTERGGA